MLFKWHATSQKNVICADRSSGNAEDIGSIRKKEIVSSARILGLRSDADVHVIEDADFIDSMHVHWDASRIAQLLDLFFIKGFSQGKRRNAREETSAGRPPDTTIDVLITFDKDGVSGHPNHRSLHAGAVHWLQTMIKGRSGWDAPVKLYRLGSTNVIRKYASLLDVPFTLVRVVLDSMSRSGKRNEKEFPSWLLFLNDFSSYRKAQRAMTEAHKSQMVWFRWGWIILSRYMVVNDLKREYIR